jgi:hypothetical protein
VQNLHSLSYLFGSSNSLLTEAAANARGDSLLALLRKGRATNILALQNPKTSCIYIPVRLIANNGVQLQEGKVTTQLN